MSKTNCAKTVARKISLINDEIDTLILSGKSYAKKAKEHARLRNLLSELQK